VGAKIYLLIQHIVSKWCSSEVVHEGSGNVYCWFQTESQAPGDILI
jgi:hypothetical protein